MTDLTRYLRRADVEGLLQTKIDHCDTKLEELRAKPTRGMTTEQLAVIARDVADYTQRRSALVVAKHHLDFCEQFDLTHQPDAATPDLLRTQNGQPVEMVRA